MDHTELFHTSNLKLAATLATLGFDPHEAPITRQVRSDGNETTIFWFKASHPHNGESAFDVFQNFTKRAEFFAESDPEHPINYMRAVLQNRDEFIDLIRNTPRDVVIERNGRRIAIRETASEETKKKFAALL
jgi:hypothetical protein